MFRFSEEITRAYYGFRGDASPKLTVALGPAPYSCKRLLDGGIIAVGGITTSEPTVMESLKGHLLVASPHLLDPNFIRTVVLLIHHSEEGAFGVVLNRPADNTIKELWEQVGDTPCKSDRRVNVGGPVAGPLMAVHTDEELGELEILPGIYFAAQRDHLEELLQQTDRPYRIFVGHSGWGGGQLENELKEGAWLTTPATVDHVFDDDADLWKKVAQHIGESMLFSSLKIKHVPRDPSVN